MKISIRDKMVDGAPVPRRAVTAGGLGHRSLRGKCVTRRAFAVGTGVALAAGFLKAGNEPGEPDWRAAFRACGFDPEAAGCGVFAVVSDVHVGTSNNDPLRAVVRFCNAMAPRPAFLLSCGDQLCRVSTCFGERGGGTPARLAENEQEIALLKEILAPLQIPFKQVIGNHDTRPDELDGAYYCGHFPAMRPYERYDVLGIQVLLLNGGHDGWIDPKQEAWLQAERTRLDPSRAVALVVHQPSMTRYRENGITQTVRRVFGDWRGELWLLGGHEHGNALKHYALPGGGTLAAVTHVRGPRGFWLYGVRNGSIAARLFFEPEGLVTGEFGPSKGMFTGWRAPVRGKMPADLPARVPLLVPFEGVQTLWRCFIGDEQDHACRVEVKNGTDAGHWLYYIGRTVYRLPLRKCAPQATQAAFLGRLTNHRKTKAHENVYLSADGVNWTLCPDVVPTHDLYVYPISEDMRTAEWVYLRVDGFGYDCDSCLAGFALL